jgi:hypothetical protein
LPQASFSAVIDTSTHMADFPLAATLLRHLNARHGRHVQQRGAGDLYLPVGPRPLARMLFTPGGHFAGFFYFRTSGCSIGNIGSAFSKRWP